MKALLGDICHITTGQSAPQEQNAFSDEGIPFIRAGSLEGLLAGKQEDNFELINAENAAKYRLKLFPKDTVVFAKGKTWTCLSFEKTLLSGKSPSRCNTYGKNTSWLPSKMV